jgi:NADH-quinone oxidoreductase subunit J
MSAFYLVALVALISTAAALTRTHAIHGLLYLVISFLSVAMILDFYGAPFVAALEVIIYAGAIMVLFVFATMMLPEDATMRADERRLLGPRAWIGPLALAGVLAIELVLALSSPKARALEHPPTMIAPKTVAVALYERYLVSVELVSLMLIAGLVGAYHLARRSAS